MDLRRNTELLEKALKLGDHDESPSVLLPIGNRVRNSILQGGVGSLARHGEASAAVPGLPAETADATAGGVEREPVANVLPLGVGDVVAAVTSRGVAVRVMDPHWEIVAGPDGVALGGAFAFTAFGEEDVASTRGFGDVFQNVKQDFFGERQKSRHDGVEMMTRRVGDCGRMD
ncbi:hypothetical protein PG985_013575 [Apiospora marii]|uniref:Uncharacterized protein n=1 Tax=Apiospora marii TaxID=335849 RepID=A0ABR1R7R2_9PEZI